jgi:hypothetical protein
MTDKPERLPPVENRDRSGGRDRKADGELLTPTDIANILGVDQSTVSEYMREMPVINLGHRTKRVRRVDFEAWLTARTEVPRKQQIEAAARTDWRGRTNSFLKNPGKRQSLATRPRETLPSDDAQRRIQPTRPREMVTDSADAPKQYRVTRPRKTID